MHRWQRAVETQREEERKTQIEGTWKGVKNSPTTFPDEGQADCRTGTATPKALHLQKANKKTKQKSF